MPAFTVPFDAPFHEQVDHAKAKNVVLPEEYYRLPAEKRAQAFTASGLAKLDQVQAVADALAKIHANGGTMADFKKWAKTQDWSLPGHRLDTIYRNAAQSAYMAGHWRSFEESTDSLPYLMYDAVNDGRTRPSHLALDGVIKPVGDAWWATHSPPLGHRCRCSVRAIDRNEARERGGVTHNAPAEGNADSGWGSDPRQWSKTLRGLIEQRQRACAVDSANFGRKQRPVAQNVDCTDWGAKLLQMLTVDRPFKLDAGLPEDFYLAAFKHSVGGYRTIEADGARLEIDDRLFRQESGELKLFKRQREQYVQHIAMAIKEPDEIYQVAEPDRMNPGEFRIVRRYLREFSTEDGPVLVVAVFTLKEGTYTGTTAFVPLDRKGLADFDYFHKQRIGVRLK